MADISEKQHTQMCNVFEACEGNGVFIHMNSGHHQIHNTILFLHRTWIQDGCYTLKWSSRKFGRPIWPDWPTAKLWLNESLDPPECGYIKIAWDLLGGFCLWGTDGIHGLCEWNHFDRLGRQRGLLSSVNTSLIGQRTQRILLQRNALQGVWHKCIINHF